MKSTAVERLRTHVLKTALEFTVRPMPDGMTGLFWRSQSKPMARLPNAGIELALRNGWVGTMRRWGRYLEALGLSVNEDTLAMRHRFVGLSPGDLRVTVLAQIVSVFRAPGFAGVVAVRATGEWVGLSDAGGGWRPMTAEECLAVREDAPPGGGQCRDIFEAQMLFVGASYDDLAQVVPDVERWKELAKAQEAEATVHRSERKRDWDSPGLG